MTLKQGIPKKVSLGVMGHILQGFGLVICIHADFDTDLDLFNCSG